jgi:hypothetical protein
MLKKAHYDQIKAAWPFVWVLFAGAVVFLADVYELENPLFRELVLAVICLVKSIWFVRFVIRRVRVSTEQTFFFHEFMAFIGVSVLLFVLSYAIDFYCLFQINPNAFQGLPAQSNLVDDFAAFCYFSVTNFTTAGLGDIVPVSNSARFFVASELVISFFFSIFVIANLALLRESFVQKRQK